MNQPVYAFDWLLQASRFVRFYGMLPGPLPFQVFLHMLHALPRLWSEENGGMTERDNMERMAELRGEFVPGVSAEEEFDGLFNRMNRKAAGG